MRPPCSQYGAVTYSANCVHACTRSQAGGCDGLRAGVRFSTSVYFLETENQASAGVARTSAEMQFPTPTALLGRKRMGLRFVCTTILERKVALNVCLSVCTLFVFAPHAWGPLWAPFVPLCACHLRAPLCACHLPPAPPPLPCWQAHKGHIRGPRCPACSLVGSVGKNLPTSSGPAHSWALGPRV